VWQLFVDNYSISLLPSAIGQLLCRPGDIAELVANVDDQQMTVKWSGRRHWITRNVIMSSAVGRMGAECGGSERLEASRCVCVLGWLLIVW